MGGGLFSYPPTLHSTSYVSVTQQIEYVVSRKPHLTWAVIVKWRRTPTQKLVALAQKPVAPAQQLVALAPKLVALAQQLVALAPKLVALAPKLVALAPKLVALAQKLVALARKLVALVSGSRDKGAVSGSRMGHPPFENGPPPSPPPFVRMGQPPFENGPPPF